MTTYPLLSEDELATKPVYTSLEDAFANAEQCYQLELSDGDLTADTLAAALPQLPRLQSLILTEQKMLEDLPAELTDLHNLEYLELRNLSIRSLPERIHQLKNLTDIVVTACPMIEELPAGIVKLNELIYLEISGTQIDQLPRHIGELKTLEDLNVNNNKLHGLPESIGGLESLQTLRTYGNYAMEIPGDALSQLTELKTFDHGVIQFKGRSLEEVKAELPDADFNQISTGDPIYEG